MTMALRSIRPSDICTWRKQGIWSRDSLGNTNPCMSLSTKSCSTCIARYGKNSCMVLLTSHRFATAGSLFKGHLIWRFHQLSLGLMVAPERSPYLLPEFCCAFHQQYGIAVSDTDSMLVSYEKSIFTTSSTSHSVWPQNLGSSRSSINIIMKSNAGLTN